MVPQAYQLHRQTFHRLFEYDKTVYSITDTL